MNPIVKLIKPILLLPFDLGINSSTTTYIIAPPASANKYGIKKVILYVKNVVIKALIGSTIPDIIPYFIAFFLSFEFISATTIPSGILCRVIANDNVNACFIDIMFDMLPAKPTPVAIPSGILCNIIAITIIIFEQLFFLLIFKSKDNIINIPNNIPNVGGNQKCFDSSIDGIIRDKNDATSITPADIPNAI